MRAGWLGLGAMGAPMAARLARAGHLVQAYDIVPGRAAALAADLPALARSRAELRERMRRSPLCDAPRFARDFEAGLRAMWRDWCAGAP